jgi:tetratricopeptide (TPR) repeat protein
MNIFLIYVLTIFSLFTTNVEASFLEGKKALDAGDYNQAIDYFKEEVAQGNHNAKFYLAFSYHEKRDYESAKEWYLKVPSSSAALYNLSIIEFSTGHYKNAGVYMSDSANKYGVKYFYDNKKNYSFFREVMYALPSDSKIYREMVEFSDNVYRYSKSQSDDRNSGKWKVADGDFNNDGKFTIKDIWSGLKWIFFYLGDLIHFQFLYTLPTGFSDFLELDESYYGGWLSGITSFFCWSFILGVILELKDKFYT